MDLDEESKLKNLFWADKRSRLAYKYYGDVVTFDTTYLTNKYDMPFAPFVGVNHHGQSILLGCGLICCEETESFVWLFQTWLECMGGIPPGGIITDQDRSMKSAIATVFPSTRHRWCLWHIMKKAPKKLGNCVEKEKILWTLNNIIYDIFVPHEFETSWKHMLCKYGIENNDWLTGLFLEKERWVPCYLRTTFWAGMSTTQRSKSINAFFDGYVHAKTTLTQFVEQYERALRKRVEDEFQADTKSFAKNFPCATTYPMEKQVQEVYTLEKFKEFQIELTAKVYCDIASCENGLVYAINEDICGEDFYKRKTFVVQFNKETNVATCSCHLFEFRGIVCRHCLIVLIRNQVKILPDHYILDRWRRDLRRTYTLVRMEYDGLSCSPEQTRYEMMCAHFQELANLVANDEARSKEIMEWIAEKVNSSQFMKGKSVLTMDSVEDEQTMPTIFGPTYSKRKGAPRKNRLKSTIEKKTRKRKGDKKRKGNGENVGPSERLIQTSGSAQVQSHPWEVLGADGVYDLTICDPISDLDLHLGL